MHLRLTPLVPLVTRVRCHVTRSDGRDSVKVEWDPLNEAGLVRYASILDGAQAPIRISCSADPSRHAVQGGLNFAWQFEGAPNEHFGTVWDHKQLKGYRSDQLDGQNKTSPAPLIQVDVADTAELVDEESSLLVTTSQRALGLPSTPGLVDLAQVITEIIVDRAEAEMMRVARRQLERALDCDEKSDWKHFCTAIKTVRLEDAVTTIDTLVAALGQDMLEQAEGNATTPGLRLAFKLASEVLAGRRESLRGAAQRLVLSAAEGDEGFKTALAMALQGTSIDPARLRRLAEEFDDRVTVRPRTSAPSVDAGKDACRPGWTQEESGGRQRSGRISSMSALG